MATAWHCHRVGGGGSPRDYRDSGFTLDDKKTKKLATSTQQLLAAVSAAPTAFIAAVSVSAESADGNIGDLIKTKFREKFVMTLTRTESRCRRDPGRRRST